MLVIINLTDAQRAELVIADILAGIKNNGNAKTTGHTKYTPQTLLTPADVAKKERFVTEYRSLFAVDLDLEPLLVSQSICVACTAMLCVPNKHTFGTCLSRCDRVDIGAQMLYICTTFYLCNIIFSFVFVVAVTVVALCWPLLNQSELDQTSLTNSKLDAILNNAAFVAHEHYMIAILPQTSPQSGSAVVGTNSVGLRCAYLCGCPIYAMLHETIHRTRSYCTLPYIDVH